MLDAELLVKHQRSPRNLGWQESPGITNCAVSAFSVVLIAQMWKSCTSRTFRRSP